MRPRSVSAAERALERVLALIDEPHNHGTEACETCRWHTRIHDAVYPCTCAGVGLRVKLATLAGAFEHAPECQTNAPRNLRNEPRCPGCGRGHESGLVYPDCTNPPVGMSQQEAHEAFCRDYADGLCDECDRAPDRPVG